MGNLNFCTLLIGLTLLHGIYGAEYNWIERKDQMRLGNCSDVSLDDLIDFRMIRKWAIPFVERSELVRNNVIHPHYHQALSYTFIPSLLFNYIWNTFFLFRKQHGFKGEQLYFLCPLRLLPVSQNSLFTIVIVVISWWSVGQIPWLPREIVPFLW